MQSQTLNFLGFQTVFCKVTIGEPLGLGNCFARWCAVQDMHWLGVQDMHWLGVQDMHSLSVQNMHPVECAEYAPG
jgi:hypothetical protein